MLREAAEWLCLVATQLQTNRAEDVAAAFASPSLPQWLLETIEVRVSTMRDRPSSLWWTVSVARWLLDSGHKQLAACATNRLIALQVDRLTQSDSLLNETRRLWLDIIVVTPPCTSLERFQVDLAW